LDTIESGATADQTAGEIKTAYESNLNTNAYTDSEKTKLSGIEAEAQVNVGDVFDSSGTYLNLRAQATTAADTGAEPAFAKNSAFNKNFGSTIGTVTEGDDSRLSDDRTPLTHGNEKHSENYLTGNETIALTGDVSGFGTTSITVTIADDSHNHIIGNIDGLATALAAKAVDADISVVGKTGSYSDLLNKPDLSVLEEVTTHANLAAFPATGETGKVYIAEDTGFMYRWSGTEYIQLTGQTAIWGEINGTLSNQTDLQSALNTKEPTFSKNTAFNKNFGTTAETVTEGDDSRLSNARTPVVHGDEAHSETYIIEGDSRLSNSREWTASTVLQSEAEAGTSTTRRA